MTQPVIAQGNNIYQMKDIDIIYWYPAYYCRLNGLDTTDSQSQAIFFEIIKKDENIPFCSVVKLNFWVSLFKIQPFEDQLR